MIMYLHNFFHQSVAHIQFDTCTHNYPKYLYIVEHSRDQFWNIRHTLSWWWQKIQLFELIHPKQIWQTFDWKLKLRLEVFFVRNKLLKLDCLLWDHLLFLYNRIHNCRDFLPRKLETLRRLDGSLVQIFSKYIPY